MTLSGLFVMVSFTFSTLIVSLAPSPWSLVVIALNGVVLVGLRAVARREGRDLGGQT